MHVMLCDEIRFDPDLILTQSMCVTLALSTRTSKFLVALAMGSLLSFLLESVKGKINITASGTSWNVRRMLFY